MTVTYLSGVMGWPISHSLSPKMHGYWLRELGLNGHYIPMAVAPGTLEAALAGLKSLGFRGCNVTVPHKESVAALMDELLPTAQRIRAVNTVIIREGKLIGESTDGLGFMNCLTEEAPGWQREQPAVVLGAGGAARAIVDALQQAGVKEIRIINRTPQHTDQLARDLKLDLKKYTWGEASLALDGAGLLVNTTTLGMKGQPPLHLELERLPLSAVVFDCVYNPRDTDLLKMAVQRGNTIVNGLGMLMHQGVPGFEAWFGQTPKVSPALRTYLESALA